MLKISSNRREVGIFVEGVSTLCYLGKLYTRYVRLLPPGKVDLNKDWPVIFAKVY